MISSLFFSLVLAVELVSSLPWNGPHQTDAARASRTANWSPAPTSVRKEDVPFHELLRRDLFPVSVCGWVGGRATMPAYCSTRSSCVWNSDFKIVGCCATASDECKFYTSCLDINSPNPEGNRDDVFTCKGTSVCYSNKYPNGFSQWGCGSSEWATSVLTAFPGMGAISLQLVTTGTAKKSTSSISTTSDSTQSTDNPTTTSDSSTSSQTPPTSVPTGSSSPQNTSTHSSAGPIAGGVIGGVAVISCLLGLCLFGRRKGWFSKKDVDKQRYSLASAKDLKETPSPQPMEGTINLDSNPLYEMDAGEESQAKSPPVSYQESALSPESTHGWGAGVERRGTQVSDVSRLSELPTTS